MFKLAGKDIETVFIRICHLFINRAIYDIKEESKSNFERCSKRKEDNIGDANNFNT